MAKIDYYQRCDLTYQKVRNSKMRRRWDGLMVAEEDWDPKPKIFSLRSANSLNIIPDNARGDRPLKVYTPLTDAEIQNQYKQYNS
jgi:hypothetical protein